MKIPSALLFVVLAVTLAMVPMLTMALAADPEIVASSPSGDFLVGEWVGYWSVHAFGDKIYLTIKSVSGNRVVATILIYGRARYHNPELPITGTLSSDGTVLSLSNEYVAIDLNILSSTEMRGRGRGDHSADFELTKTSKK